MHDLLRVVERFSRVHDVNTVIGAQKNGWHPASSMDALDCCTAGNAVHAHIHQVSNQAAVAGLSIRHLLQKRFAARQSPLLRLHRQRGKSQAVIVGLQNTGAVCAYRHKAFPVTV